MGTENGVRVNKVRLLCISLACVFSSFAHSQDITFSINDWCPYICDSPTKKTGILVEIVQDIFQEEGYKVNFKNMTLNRAVIEIQNNRVQGMVGIVPEVLPDLIFPEEPVIKTQFCFFTLPKQAWKFDNFKGYYPEARVGVVAGKNISADFDKAFPKQETISGEKRTAERLMEMLARQRVDVIVEERKTISYLLKQNPSFPNVRTAGCAEKKNEYVAFSPTDPNSKKYAELFSKGIKRLRESGKIEEIVSSYVD